MNAKTVNANQVVYSWIGDLWGGLAAMLVALPSSIAFGVLIYTVLGPEYAGLLTRKGENGINCVSFK